MEERHASRDGGVEAPFLAHVGPEHPEPVPPFFHDGEHLQGLACVRATPPAPVRRARNAAGIRARPPWSAPTSEFGHVCSANARTRAVCTYIHTYIHTCVPGGGVDAVASPQQRADEPGADVAGGPRDADSRRRQRATALGLLLFVRRAATDADAAHLGPGLPRSISRLRVRCA